MTIETSLNTRSSFFKEEIVTSKAKEGTFNSLPSELQQRIFSFLDPKSLINAALVCHNWKLQAFDQQVWKQLHFRDFPLLKDPLYNVYIPVEESGMYEETDTPDWKESYKAQFIFDSNVRTGKGRFEDCQIGPTSTIFYDHKRRASIFCAGSQVDQSLHKLGTEDSPFFYIGTSKEPCFKVRSFCASHDYLFSCSDTELCIRVWDDDTENDLPVLVKIFRCDSESHQKPLTSLCTDGKTLFSGALDGTFCIWDVEKGDCLATHSVGSPILKLCCSNGKVFLGLEAGNILMWDIQEKKFLETFKGHQKQINALHAANDKLFSSSQDDTVRMWDINNRSDNQILDIPTAQITPVLTLCSMRGKLFGGGWRRFYVWDIMTGKFLQKFDAWTIIQNRALTFHGLQFNGEKTDLVTILETDSKHDKLVTQLSSINLQVLSSINLQVGSVIPVWNSVIRIWDFGHRHNDLKDQVEDIYE